MFPKDRAHYNCYDTFGWYNHFPKPKLWKIWLGEEWVISIKIAAAGYEFFPWVLFLKPGLFYQQSTFELLYLWFNCKFDSALTKSSSCYLGYILPLRKSNIFNISVFLMQKITLWQCTFHSSFLHSKTGKLTCSVVMKRQLLINV